MKLSAIPKASFEGFYVGPVIAALVLATGIKACVMGITAPLSSLVIDEFVYLIRRSYPDAVPAASTVQGLEVPLGWLISGIILLVLGMALASWLANGREKPPQ